MLKIFRDNIKYLSWILWVVIAIFVLFVFVDFGGTVPGGTAAADAAATVGNDRVTYAEFERQYRALEDRYRQSFGAQFTPELAKQLKLPLSALDQLISEKILLAEARRLELAVSDEELRQRLLEIPAFLDEQGNFVGRERYRDLLRANRYSVPAFEDEVRNEILLDKLRSTLRASVYVPDSEVEEKYRERVERARIRYLQLRPEAVAADAAELSDVDLASYYERHQDEYQLPERRVAAYLLVDTNALREAVEPTPAEIEAYFQAHQEEFTTDEEVHARHILIKETEERSAQQAETLAAEAQRRLAAGGDFATVAAELSDDPGSKSRGGDLGFFGRGRMIKEFEDAAFAAQPGQVVGPVKTSFGYHLIEVLERRPGGVKPLAEAAPMIRARLQSERSASDAEAKARALYEKAVAAEVEAEAGLQALAAEEPAARVEVTPAFGRTDVVAGIGRATPFAAAAFELEPGKKVLAEPIQTPRGWAIVLLKEVQPPRLPDLAEVEPQVREAALRDSRLEAAKAKLQQVRERIASGGLTLEQAAGELGVEVVESDEFAPNGEIKGLGPQPALAEAVLAMEPGQVGGPVALPEGAVLFEVLDKKSFDPALFATEKERTRDELTAERVNQLVAALIEQRRRELNVQYDRRLLESFELLGDEARS